MDSQAVNWRRVVSLSEPLLSDSWQYALMSELRRYKGHRVNSPSRIRLGPLDRLLHFLALCLRSVAVKPDQADHEFRTESPLKQRNST